MTEILWEICAWTGIVWWCCLFIVLLYLLFLAGVAAVEAFCAQWEENEIRRIVASNDIPRPLDKWAMSARGAEADEPCRGLPRQPLPTGDDLPANWQELDGERSFDAAWTEVRRRKSSGA